MADLSKASEHLPGDERALKGGWWTGAKEAGGGEGLRWLALVCGVAAFLVWFVWWPYQHWQFDRRLSVFHGWVKVLSLDANAEWQFCFVVPLIAGFLVYRQKAWLAALPLKGSWWGLVPLGLAVVFYWFGYKVDTGYLGYAAVQLSLAGFVLLLGGKAWMRALLLPWVFMAFAWPLFPLDTLLAAKLKIPTAFVAEKAMSLVGIDVVRSGSTLQSAADFAGGIKQGERFTLDVADSCSGMRSLYALIMVAVLYSFMALRRMGPRLMLSLSAIPLAVAGNVVRLWLLTVGSLLFGQEWAVGRRVGEHQEESFFHILAGFMVFGVALAGMFALATWLEGRPWKKSGQGKSRKVAAPRLAAAGGDEPGKIVLKSAAALGVTLAALLWCQWTPEKPVLREPGFAAQLPEWVGDYRGEALEMSYKERINFDPTVTLLRRSYTSQSHRGRPVMATMVISGEMKRTLHPPQVCLPDQGWIITGEQQVALKLETGRVVHASLMRMFREQEVAPGRRVRLKAMNLYWYQGSDGNSTPGYNMSHFINYRDAILFGLNHRWSQAAFFMPVSETEVGMEDPLGEVIAMQELTDFASKVASTFVK